MKQEEVEESKNWRRVGIGGEWQVDESRKWRRIGSGGQ